MRAVLIFVSNGPKPAVCRRRLACYMGSRSITCHPIRANLSLPYIWEEGQTSAYYCRNRNPVVKPVPICTVWWTEAHVCEQLAQGRYLAVPGSESNLQPQGYKFGMLPNVRILRWQQLSIMQQFGASAFNMVVHWPKLGEVDNECTSHNSIILTIYVPKIIKFGGDLTKFQPQQVGSFFGPPCN